MHRLLLLLVAATLSSNGWANLNFFKDFSLRPIEIKDFSKKATMDIFANKEWPPVIEFHDKKYNLEYTLDEKLEKYIKKELRRYSSDYASVVVIDNNTGEILSALDYSRKGRKFGKNLTFSATNPAASVFKVITASDLIENHQLKNDSPFQYNGKATTLYKYQLKNKKNKWTRYITFKKAFARSNNVVFGKAAIEHSNFSSLTKMAKKFGFNKNLLQLVDMGNSKLFDRDSEYGLAEFASGFNKGTMISPIHGAVIASVAANGGYLKLPHVVSRIEEATENRLIWEPEESRERVMSPDSAREMRKLMELTVSRGTARSAFRRFRPRRVKNVTIGGKTGTITGGLPMGKRDWFVSYAMPQDSDDKGISVCVMIVNVNKWYIKSSVLAKNIIEYYYSKKYIK
jgi:peptidoglycan glycosyltransferase